MHIPSSNIPYQWPVEVCPTCGRCPTCGFVRPVPTYRPVYGTGIGPTLASDSTGVQPRQSDSSGAFDISVSGHKGGGGK